MVRPSNSLKTRRAKALVTLGDLWRSGSAVGGSSGAFGDSRRASDGENYFFCVKTAPAGAAKAMPDFSKGEITFWGGSKKLRERQR